MQNDKELVTKALEIQKYLTCVLLQNTCLNRFLPILDDKLFGKYSIVWSYVRDNGTWYQPDLVDIATRCGITDTEEVVNLWMQEFVWQPKKYLEELLKMTYYLNIGKYKMSWYEELMNILKKIDEVQSWFDKEKYSISSISWNIMDQVYAWTYMERTRVWIKEIDDALNWGIPKGSVTTIGAYSNTGKSKFAYFLASNFLKQWKKVLFFNLEVPKETALKNILASYSWSHADYSSDVWDYLNSYVDLPLTVVDDKWDWESIKIFAQSCDADVIFLDFVQNIEIQGDGIYEQTSKLAKRIQRFAIENNVTVISISQLSNDGARGYKAGDIIPMKWGGELVASSDICLMLQNDATNGRIINLTVAKNKFGKKEDVFWLSVDYKNNMFKLTDSNVPKVIYQ
jgi:archaellum biogenesis ATPase FlaH